MVNTSAIRGKVRVLGLAIFIVAIFLCSFLMMTWKASAQGIESTSTILDEEFTIELNNVGDAHVTDTFKYDRAWFNSYGYVFEDYPFLLSRRYKDESGLRELTDFSANVDRANYTITVTFDVPGEAYNEGNYWRVLGYPYKPKFENEGQFIFENEWTQNNEFTLWSDMQINYTGYFLAPPGATNLRWNEAKKQLEYDLPYTTVASSNPLASNRALFIALFAILMIASLAGAILFMTRKAIVPAAAGAPFTGMPAASENVTPPAMPMTPGAPPSPPTIEPAEAEVTQPPTPAASEPAPETPAEKGSNFCKFCGGQLKHAGAKFCSSCGKEQI